MRSSMLSAILVAFVIGCTFAGEQQVFHHVTCQRDYAKVGCLLNQHHLFRDVLMKTNETSTDWNQFGDHLHNMACLCHQKAHEGGYKLFAIGNYGTCYGSKDLAGFEAVLKDSSQLADDCLSGNWYEECDNDNQECSGGPDSVFAYSFRAAMPTKPAPINGGYSAWSEWTKCSASCGKGMQERERTCTNPPPSRNGKDCEELGKASEVKECNLQECKLIWEKRDNQYYHFSSLKLTWDDAEEYCNKYGGHLASIHSQQESEFVKTESLKRKLDSPYVGGTDAGHEQIWLWVDGSYMIYKRWALKEPNNAGGKEHCLQIRNTHKGASWNDIPCNQKRNFVCKMSYFHGHTYFFSVVKKNFDDAEKVCESMNGHLASIHSQAENDYIHKEFAERLDARNPWIGFEDRVKAGDFKWIDGSAVGYKHWNNGEPNYIGQERCGHIITDKSGRWNNRYCTSPNSFVCKMEAPEPALINHKDLDSVPFGQAAYHFSKNAMSWLDAESECVNMGGHLASIHSEAEKDFVFNEAEKKGMGRSWIGGNDRAREGAWVWSDMSTFSYKSWGNKEPNNNNEEDCMNQGRTGKALWNDLKCNKKLPFVCKILYFAGNRYFISSGKKNWMDAEKHCVEIGGHLTSIHSKEENEFLYKELVKRKIKHPFIGFQDQKQEGKWVWSDGSTVDYKLWSRREPNNLRNEDCAHMKWHGSAWNDIKCTNKYQYICKF